MDELDRLGIDDETGRLFWDDKEVVTSMSLPSWVHISAVVTAISTAVAALATVAPVLKDLVKYLSQ